jgi:aminomethyltransferase
MPPDAALRQSPLADRHRGLGAKLTTFAGWEMPLDYGSVVAEHDAVRTACGVFDLSHLGMFTVAGDGAGDALQHAFTNDIERLRTGRAHYTLCCDDDGGIVDDLLVYRLDVGHLVICNAANVDAVRASVANGPGDPRIVDRNDAYACIAVQGPASVDVALTAGLDVHGMAFLDCRQLDVPSPGPAASDTGADEDGFADGLIARSGYTGERGYEIVVPAARAGDLWDRLLAADGVAPAGLGARDLLRLEMGYPLHGHELHAGTTPAEAGLWFAVAADTDFRGAGPVGAAHEQVTRRLRGLRATGRGVPRADQAVLVDRTEVGRTTSGSFSPTLGTGIALAYLDVSVAVGDEVVIDVRGRELPATVVRPPFVDADPRD